MTDEPDHLGTLIRTSLRAQLGTDILPRLESRMSEITDALNALALQVNAVSATQATSFTNLQNAITELKSGKLSAEQKEIVGRIEESLVKLGDDAQRADDGTEPAEPTNPDVPAEPTPADPNTPADNA